MHNEVSQLRSLAVELHQADLTLHDAGEGVNIIKKFNKLGIKPEQQMVFIKVCGKIHDPRFVSAAAKLSSLEDENGLSYDQAISQYQQAVQELPLVKSKLKEVKSDLLDTTAKLKGAESKLAGYEVELKATDKKLKDRLAEADYQIKIKMNKTKVTQEEIEEVASLKANLAKGGLDLQTLINLSKEFIYGENSD